MKSIAFIIILLTFSLVISAQEYRLKLYESTIPNSGLSSEKELVEKSDIIRISNVRVPDIAVYLPSKKNATGQAVVICPGGGYRILAYDWEGTDIAGYLNSIGVAAIVLKYRLPSYGTMTYPHEVPLMDAKRAMRLVRQNASRWNIDRDKIGVMGFSAGGHLASTLATHFDYGNMASADSVEKQSCRPDFMILMYPVITFTEASMHKGSRDALLGKEPSSELIKFFSNELQVRDDTPPTFLVHADNDKGVPVENALLMYMALREKNIPSELHILSEGDHGFGLAVKNEHVAAWTENLRLWLKWADKYIRSKKEPGNSE